MNIVNKLINNFKKNKTCLFCNSKLKPNKEQVILLLDFNPHYCNSCAIDYSADEYGMLRIEYKNFIFSIDICGMLEVWSSYTNKLYKKPIPNALDKEQLYNHFDRIIKEHVFQ